MTATVLIGGLAAVYGYTTSKPKPREERMKRTFKYGLGFGAIGLALDMGVVWSQQQRAERARLDQNRTNPGGQNV